MLLPQYEQSLELKDDTQHVNKLVNERPGHQFVMLQAYLKSTYADKKCIAEVGMVITSMLCVYVFVSTFLINMNIFLL